MASISLGLEWNPTPPNDLYGIPEFHGLVWFAGQSKAQPVYAPPYWEIPELAGRYDSNPYDLKEGR